MSESKNMVFIRRWFKMPSMKELHERFGVYRGAWSRQMDRYWESNDGFTVSSRLIRTAIGTVEHVAISRLSPDKGDIPWAIKQEIKNELFGLNAVAIEVFPAKKHLVDVCDVYHLWVLPKNFSMPFGLHPTRDPECPAIERGYDVMNEQSIEWHNSDERKRITCGVNDASALGGDQRIPRIEEYDINPTESLNDIFGDG